MPCKSYYCTQSIRSYAHPDVEDSRRPRTETLRPCQWLLRPACPGPGHCRRLGTAPEWWPGWQAAVHKVLKEKWKSRPVRSGLWSPTFPHKDSVSQEWQGSHLPARAPLPYSAVFLWTGMGLLSECFLALLHNRPRWLLIRLHQENQGAQFSKVQAPKHCKQQDPNEAVTSSLQCPLPLHRTLIRSTGRWGTGDTWSFQCKRQSAPKAENEKPI